MGKLTDKKRETIEQMSQCITGALIKIDEDLEHIPNGIKFMILHNAYEIILKEACEKAELAILKQSIKNGKGLDEESARGLKKIRRTATKFEEATEEILYGISSVMQSGSGNFSKNPRMLEYIDLFKKTTAKEDDDE